MKKINVVGVSGSGKSTFARQLADRLAYPYLEMDALFWEKNWQEPADEIFFKRLAQALQQEVWVLDGNYSRTTPIKWVDVDTVIWIDFSFPRTLYQSVSRALRRAVSQKELWPGTGNRESWRKLFSRDSIVWWMLKSYRSKKKQYLRHMEDPANGHLRFVRLRSPAACKAFLKAV
jgi:adenylate kinase family enzyme